MKKIVLIIVALFIVAALAVPMVVKKQVDTKIEAQKKELMSNGVELLITKNEGYLSNIKEFKLKIVNGKKFRDFILKNSIQNSPNYRGLVKIIKQGSNKDIRPALDGTTFKGVIKTSNLLLEDPSIEISLTRLSDEIMLIVDNDKTIFNLVNPVLSEKVITFYVTLNSNQKISKIIMKDIDRDINDNGKTISLKLINHMLNIDISKSLSGVYNVGQLLIKKANFYIKAEGLKYDFDYLTQYDNEAAMHVKSFEMKERQNVFKIGNMDIDSKIETVEKDMLNFSLAYSIKDLYFKERTNAMLDRFIFNFHISNLDKEGIVTANKSYSKIALGTTAISQNDIKAMSDSAKKILNRGFESHIDSSVSSLIIENTEVEKIDFTFEAKLDKNQYSLKDVAMINALKLNGKVTLYQKDLEALVKLDGSLKQFANIAKKDGNKALFEYKLKQGNLYINGIKQ